MESIDSVMIAIAAQLTNETGIRAGDVVPNAINPPEVFLHLKGCKPGTFGADSLELDIDVIAFVSSSVDRAQRVLYKYVSVGTPESLFDALSADPTFGLDDVSGAVGEFRNLGFDEIAAYKMYGGAISLAVSIS
jgi:hypothetical protein